MDITAGSLFLRNFLTGFLLVFISLIVFRGFEVGGSFSSIITGIAFFLINCGVLFLYTLAVLRNEELLAQEDSADYAYYLGFCLTVLTLAVSFGYDAVNVRQNPAGAEDAASQASALVKNALIQFAAGLFATVLGLCAKIYITSQQSLTTAEPEELYRRFRHEIHGFQTELRSSISGMSASFKQVSDDLSSSAQQVNQSVSELVGAIDKSSKELGTTLSKTNLDKFTTDFVQTINNLSETSAQLSSSAQSITTALSQLSATSTITNTNISNLGATVSAFDASSKSVSSSLQEYAASILNSTTQVISQGESLAQTSDQLQEFAAKTESLIKRISPLEDRLSALDNSAQVFSVSMSTISGALDILQNRIKVIETTLLSLGTSIETTTSAAEKLSRALERNAHLNDTNVDLLEALSTAHNLFQERIKLAASSVDLLSQETKKLSEFLPLFGTSITNVKLDELGTSVSRLTEVSNALIPNLSAAGPIIDQLKNSISLLSDSSSDHKQTLKDLDTALNNLTGNGEGLWRNISGLNTELEKLKDFLPLFGHSMSNINFDNLSRSVSRLADESDALAAELRSKSVGR